MGLQLVCQNLLAPLFTCQKLLVPPFWLAKKLMPPLEITGLGVHIIIALH